MNLRPLSLPEVKGVFRPQRSLRDVVELYMALGGVPQYLGMVDASRSVRANLERLCFSRDGYLVNEFERIFAGHFGTAQHYRTILRTLAKGSLASREDIERACKLASGGRLSEYLDDLELAGFVERRAPVDKPESVRTIRYRLADPYLLFYFRFIQPALRRIEMSQASPGFSNFVSDRQYGAWQGLAFEWVCSQHAPVIAEKLGFSAVKYQCGPWFSRDGNGCQIDLLFMRADRVITLCEMKFQDKKVGKAVIADVERKRQALPNPRGYTVEAVLITSSPPTEDLVREGYFHRILQLEDLFGSGS
jgi:hypothetical protein